MGIAYEDDIEKAKAAVESLIAAEPRCLKDPAPLVAVGNLGESSVDFVIRMWCASADYWPLKWDMTRTIKEKMDAEGISIPFPQRTLHMVKAAE